MDAVPLVRNLLLEKLARDEVAVSMTVKICRGIEVALVAKTAGFDALYIDLEHNSLSLDTTGQICIAAMQMGVTPLVRVPEGEPAMIGRVLDGGAQGIIIPGLSSAAEAEAVVRQVRFAPGGHRGAAGGLPQLAYRSSGGAEAQQAINDTTMVVPMIESREALENVEAIAAVDGVSFLFIGSADLTADLGIPGEVDNPKLEDAFRRTIAATRGAGKATGVGGGAASARFDGEVCGIWRRAIYRWGRMSISCSPAQPRASWRRAASGRVFEAATLVERGERR